MPQDMNYFLCFARLTAVLVADFEEGARVAARNDIPSPVSRGFGNVGSHAGPYDARLGVCTERSLERN